MIGPFIQSLEGLGCLNQWKVLRAEPVLQQVWLRGDRSCSLSVEAGAVRGGGHGLRQLGGGECPRRSTPYSSCCRSLWVEVHRHWHRRRGSLCKGCTRQGDVGSASVG